MSAARKLAIVAAIVCASSQALSQATPGLATIKEPATQLTVKIAGNELVLDAGALQPLPQVGDARPGAAQRMFNLGYGSGDPTAWDQAEFTRVLRRFQTDQGVDAAESGTLGPATRAKLVEVYGG